MPNNYSFQILDPRDLVSATIESAIAIDADYVIGLISRYVSWQGTMDFVVEIRPGSELTWSDADGLLPSFLQIGWTGSAWTNQTLTEARTGLDSDPSHPDAGLTIYLADDGTIKNYGAPVWFDPNPRFGIDPAVPAGSQDFVGLLTHEIFHSLGFVNYTQEWAARIVTEGDVSYFTGPRATALYGGPIPFRTGYDHYGYGQDPSIPIKRGLMYEYGNYSRNRLDIGRIDLAILADLGYSIKTYDGLSLFEMIDTATALVGTDSGETLWGDYHSNTISGGGGDDRLDGGLGGDTMRGGTGNDVYYVDEVADLVEESAGEGTDEVRTALSTYVLSANVENLTSTLDSAHDFRGNAASNFVTGGAVADFLRLQDGGDDTAMGGGGNDVFLFGGALTSADQVNGGPGTDQIAIQGDYWGPKSLTLGANIVGVENMAILPGDETRFGDPGTAIYDYNITMLDSAVAAGVQMVVDANRLRSNEDFIFDGSSETDGSFFIYGGGGADKLTGGALNDVFLFGAWGQWNPGDVVVGGSGIDQLALRGNYSLTFGAGQLIGIENIGLLSAHDTRFGALGSSYSYDLTMVDANVAAGVQMVVDGAKLRIAEFFRFDGSAELDGSFRVFGGLVDDVIVGSRNADLIQGNGGADTLTGGLGADVFRYLDSSDSTSSAMDKILDFAAGTDKIDFSRIDANASAAGDQAFAWIGSGAFSGTAGQLRAYQDGANWVIQGDTDGNGSADFVVLVTLDGPAPLGSNDFVL